MPFSAIRPLLAITATGLVISIAGCASKPEPMPEPELPDKSGAMNVGVNYIKPTSDIVIITPGYRHVVLPDGAQVAYRPGWEDEAMAVVAESLKQSSDSVSDDKPQTKRKTIGRSSANVSSSDSTARSLDDLPTAEESSDPIYSAWRKLCGMSPETLTDEELQIVLNEDMPSELEGLCSEGRQWLAELK
jgi:hypothetical protein